MIIGIAGRIGSGKDTVGEIIQQLTSPVIENYVTITKGEMTPDKGASSWQIKKFAAKLKQIASLMLGVPAEKFEDQEFKKTFLGSEWDIKEYHSEDSHEDYTWIHQMTVREFLQKLGTEGVRDGVHKNAWVNALFADYKLQPHAGMTRDLIYPDWIITDMRFINEMKAVKDRGGITIRVIRKLPDVDYTTMEAVHPSETQLDNEEFDHIIYNNGTIDELADAVKQILISHEIITNESARLKRSA